ncbi:type II and III secretion system protein family protein [Achromobacter sp. NFACC18-2]|uniref:type II and III secretion system protein family protein n=1 Tax=Achromobacter sp. NFACC18-2 TaxID=1564112 RepID=UPI0008D4B3C7|nr:type II and III secretion system protein family protein [Achromobacter sp. NFACC18-2]SEI59737.1 pilus assembly protein CpaC [Achromobacter sp. NFACC18-2]
MIHKQPRRGAALLMPRLCLAAPLCLAGASALAAPSTEPRPRPAVDVMNTPSALPASLQKIAPTGEITLHVREGQLLKLKSDAAKVLVADPRVASFQVPSPNNIFVFAQSVGTTALYALDAQDKVIAAIRVVAEHDLSTLRTQILRSVPGADIELEPSLNNRIIVRGNVRTPIEARQIVDQVQAYLDGVSAGTQGGGARGAGNTRDGVINQLKVELSSQINIQVRVVEVSRTLSHELGFDWAATLNSGSGAWGIMTGSAAGGFAPATETINPSLFDSVTGKNFSSLIPGRTTSTFAAGGMTTRGRFTMGGLISALSAEGFASVLAEPNLTAMSGESAAFAAGGEVPIVIITNNNVQIDFKSYGVILRMTPTLLSANRISLHIAPEVSELTEDGAVTLQGISIPALKVRRADTTVELASGQSFALAGMLRSTQAQTVSGVPGLSSIPLLGRLFEHEVSAKDETELVILVTANVVDPVAAGELQVPGQGLAGIDDLLPPQAPIGYLY